MQLWPVFTNHWTELTPAHFPRVGEELKRCSCFAPDSVCAFALHWLRARRKGIWHRNTSLLSFLRFTWFIWNFLSLNVWHICSSQDRVWFSPSIQLVFVELKLKISIWSVYISLLVIQGTTADTISLSRLLSTTQQLLHCSYCVKETQHFCELGLKLSLLLQNSSTDFCFWLFLHWTADPLTVQMHITEWDRWKETCLSQ